MDEHCGCQLLQKWLSLLSFPAGIPGLMKLWLNLLLFGIRTLTGVHGMMAVKRQQTMLGSWRASQM